MIVICSRPITLFMIIRRRLRRIFGYRRSRVKMGLYFIVSSDDGSKDSVKRRWSPDVSARVFSRIMYGYINIIYGYTYINYKSLIKT